MTSNLISEGSKNLFFLRLSLAVLLLCHLIVAFWFEFSWDEFLLLDWVYDWQEGKTTLPLQTIYLRAFTWLTSLPGNEIAQLLTARSVMVLCFALTCWFMFRIASRYASIEAAYFALICFASFSFVFRHGTSFRMDTIVTALLMGILWLVSSHKFKYIHLIIAGLFLGLAGMITVKSIFYVPVILVILFLRWQDSGWKIQYFLQAALLGVVSLASFALLYYLHSNSLNNGISGAEYLGSVTKGSLVDRGFFPQLEIAKISALQNPIYWALLSFSIILLIASLVSVNSTSLTLLAFTIPLFTLTFFVHSFPYYYCFILAPTSIALVAIYDKWLSRQSAYYVQLVLVIVALIFVPRFIQTLRQDFQFQKQIVNYVHQLFPERTAYIDRGGMISTFDHKGFFMASWQMREYLNSNMPIMAKILDEEEPKFIIANIENLDLDNQAELNKYQRLLSADIETLKDNFLHHWGPIYILGKKLEVSKNSSELKIVVSGNYVIESSVEIKIDGEQFNNGAKVFLEKGLHSITSQTSQSITIKWFTDPSIVLEPPRGEKVYRGF